MAYVVRISDKEYRVDFERRGNEFVVNLNGKNIIVEVAHEDGSLLTLFIDRKPYSVVLASSQHVLVNGESYTGELIDEHLMKLMKASPEKLHKKELTIKAPMPGLIIEVLVKEGASVSAGQGLLIVEAMKMQNELKTPRDGIVKKILVQKGLTVNSGDTLAIVV